MYWAANYTELDSVKHRSKKGYFFVIGDEKPRVKTTYSDLRKLGLPVPSDGKSAISLTDTLAKLQTTYHVFSIVPQAQNRSVISTWRSYMGDHVFELLFEDKDCISALMVSIILLTEGIVLNIDDLVSKYMKGFPQATVAKVVFALTPYAALLRMDSAPEPKLQEIY
jgi:hypothetical protein